MLNDLSILRIDSRAIVDVYIAVILCHDIVKHKLRVADRNVVCHIPTVGADPVLAAPAIKTCKAGRRRDECATAPVQWIARRVLRVAYRRVITILGEASALRNPGLPSSGPVFFREVIELQGVVL